MMDILKMFAASPCAVKLDGTTNVEDIDNLRAFQALVEVSALLGEPLQCTHQDSTVDQDSVAAWSQESLHKTRTRLLAKPSKCPPFVDPSSVAVDPASLQGELEFEEEEEEDFKPRTPKTGVRFHSTVSVVEIPSHRDMSRESIDRMWTGVRQVNEKAAINTMEWHEDGKNWRTVPEEEDMVWDSDSGEYIHPATWELIQEELRREEAIQQEWKRWEALEREFARNRIAIR